MEEKERYYSLIKNWHIKASEEDYFSRFMFEYMAFIAYLRTQWKTEMDIKLLKKNNGKVTDRDYIQALKQDEYCYSYWTDVSLREPQDKKLRQALITLVDFLRNEPLSTSDERWWNFSEFDINKKIKIRKRPGLLNGNGDFENLVEFWYSIRNNLFHGEKNPSVQRDKELVRLGFLTLNFFVENILLPLNERHRIYPAIWEDFQHRFEMCEAEVTFGSKDGPAANICECAFLENDRYPLLLLDGQLERSDIIGIISYELANRGDSPEDLFRILKNVARGTNNINKAKEYFQELIDTINKTWGLKLSFDEKMKKNKK
jgi:hypothetical protein